MGFTQLLLGSSREPFHEKRLDIRVP
jgi:hypothetical protein